jgi:hypothetical protein
MKMNTDPKPVLGGKKPLLQGANRSSSASAGAALEFGRFRLQLRHRTRRVCLGQAQSTKGNCSTVSIGLARLIDMNRRDIFASASSSV